jgi:hypothetical protein
MRRLTLLFAIVLLFGVPAVARQTKGSSYGCSSWNEYEGLLLMEAGGKTDAFRQELTRATLAGECTTFHGGEEVQVLETKTSGPDPLLGGKTLTLVKISFKKYGAQGWWTSPAVLR